MNKWSSVLLFLLGLSCTSLPVHAETRFDEILKLPFLKPTEILRYGDQDDQYGLLWSRQTAAAPLIVLIHGGCWLEAYDVAHIKPLASFLFEQGFDVWAPEYRRVGGEGGYPATFDDVGEAVEFILQHTGGDTPWAIAGHSAGGQLALWAASEPALPKPTIAIGLAAITDLETYGRADASCPKAVAQLLGGSSQENAWLYESLSPSKRIFTSPVVMIQGLTDSIVPADQAGAVSDATHRYLEGTDHFDLINPQRDATGELIKYLRRGFDE